MQSDAPLRKSNTCQQRHVKVRVTHFGYRINDQPSHNEDRSVPIIQMAGYWLQQAGFEIDTPVKVRVMDGRLVLTVDETGIV